MLKIRNWEKWQSYRKDRGQPPWIKIYRSLLRDPEWVAMSDAQRGQLVVIWLLGADKNGVIPSNPELIKKLCYMDKVPDLKVFVNKGFLEYGNQVTPSRRQDDAPDTDTDTDTDTEKKKKRSASAPLVIPDDLKDNEPEILDWLEYKKQKGQSYKPKGLEALWRSIRAIPKNKRRSSVDNSMANNWSGLFEVKAFEKNGEVKSKLRDISEI